MFVQFKCIERSLPGIKKPSKSLERLITLFEVEVAERFLCSLPEVIYVKRKSCLTVQKRRMPLHFSLRHRRDNRSET